MLLDFILKFFIIFLLSFSKIHDCQYIAKEYSQYDKDSKVERGAMNFFEIT